MPKSDDNLLLIVTPADMKTIKECGARHFERAFPKNLSADQIQAYLICQGFLDFLKRQNIEVPVKIEWVSKKNIKGNSDF